jgi:bifunctional enzyme CysN/CysC/sulfate adenylyltransferase subunit 1
MLSEIEPELREDFRSFLERDLNKELLRFTTAGSVDDGKSTLIGRLLHDAKAVYEDQLASVRKSRINRSGRAIDFSLLTDGLRAEREQGITIDVAYRYFSTARRKFIIADTPGHEQYTRNMATGASTADLAVILVDGAKGLLPQTRRHAYISALLGIPMVVAAINKMDLVDYREDVFWRLEQDFRELGESVGIKFVQCVPVSALEGDNVVARSAKMPWYKGATLMEHLETVEIRPARESGELRFPIQSVIRPNGSFRGFAGRVAGGAIRPGDSVLALPSRQQTRVRAIVTYDGELEVAVPQQSIVLRLEDEIDLSRGDLLVSPGSVPHVSDQLAASVVWLHPQPLRLNQTYLVKHSGRQLKGKATKIRHRVNINNLTEHPAEQLEMNEIASVEFETSSPLFFDPYERNRTMGSFILIDPLSNATVGAAMIREETASKQSLRPLQQPASADAPQAVTEQERSERYGHFPAVFSVNGKVDVAKRLERSLFEKGFAALLVRQDELPMSALPSVLSALWSAGTVIVFSGELSSQVRGVIQAMTEDRLFEFPAAEGPAKTDEILDQALSLAETLRIESDFLDKEVSTGHE